MQDRYLCKAKRMDNGEWVIGNPIEDGVTGQVFIHATGNSVNESDMVGEEGFLKFVAFEIDPTTLCQCTGLKAIWENDIVRLILADGETRYFKVSFKKVVRKVLCHPDFDDAVAKVELNAVCFEWNGYELFPCIDEYGISDAAKMERAGNIFDNPELLEV